MWSSLTVLPPVLMSIVVVFASPVGPGRGSGALGVVCESACCSAGAVLESSGCLAREDAIIRVVWMRWDGLEFLLGTETARREIEGIKG